MAGPTIRVGNGAGFWGDNLDAPFDLARHGRLDVLTLEYLAELTLAILSHLRSKDPNAGYVTDFPELLGRLGPILRDQEALSVVTNAGGLNPRSCASRCGALLDAAGLGGIVLAVVEGDDVLTHLPGWVKEGVEFRHLDTDRPIHDVADRLVCANAYLGARPIAGALAEGARVVVTGRVADASLTVGPAAAHFGWAWDDWARLAGASVAGHVIECGAQATGGLWGGWEDLPGLDRIGYPIAEISGDGSCTILKAEGSGGLVSAGTVAEQIVYEIDDPGHYLTPDVDLDLTTVELDDRGENRVVVRGASGRPRPENLKVSAVYRDGWTATGLLALAGRGAESKARSAGRVVLERVRRAGFDPAESLVEVIGAGDLVPGMLRPAVEPREVVLRLTVRDPRRPAVERFCREIAPLVTSGPPGIAGYATARPTPRPAFGYWPALVPRGLVEAQTNVTSRTAREWSRGGSP